MNDILAQRVQALVDIDGELLLELDEEMLLDDLRVASKLDRRKIVAKQRRLREQSGQQSAAALDTTFTRAAPCRQERGLDERIKSTCMRARTQTHFCEHVQMYPDDRSRGNVGSVPSRFFLFWLFRL